jgi:hypothetical protein
MAFRCGPASMKAFMADWVVHRVRVQNVLSLSLSSEVYKFPCDLLACRAERIAKKMNAGRYRQERTRKRVMETVDIALRPSPFLSIDRISS